MDKKAFQRLLKSALSRSGMTMREAAAACSTAPGTISRWINGHSAPAVMARAKIIEVIYGNG